jgi:hypothetical protein
MLGVRHDRPSQRIHSFAQTYIASTALHRHRSFSAQADTTHADGIAERQGLGSARGPGLPC